jgi:hypothetical protein
VEWAANCRLACGRVSALEAGHGVGKRRNADLTKSQRSGLNWRPPDYESGALPLSYAGVLQRRARRQAITDLDSANRCSPVAVRCRSTMPWHGLEPWRLAAPPPQDGVSTNFTTRARTNYKLQIANCKLQIENWKELRIVNLEVEKFAIFDLQFSIFN